MLPTLTRFFELEARGTTVGREARGAPLAAIVPAAATAPALLAVRARPLGAQHEAASS
jgi:hypothetical protein